jgi:hypothetical protein
MEGIGQTLNREDFEATEKCFCLVEGSSFGDDISSTLSIYAA